MQKAIIVDLDGTLADCSHRINKAKDPETGKINWQIFYADMDKDVLVPKVFSFVYPFRAAGYSIVVVTGRPEEYREITEDWLKSHGFELDHLVMRPDADRRPAPVFKKSVVKHELEGMYDIVLAIDDDLRIAEMFQKDLSIPCIVPGGLEHIQQNFNSLDSAAINDIVGKIVGAHLIEAFLNENRVPPDTQIGWVRDLCVSIARKVAEAVRG